MVEKQAWERRSGVGGLVAAGGGLLVVLATFMTWFELRGGFGVTGWDLVHEDRRPSGNFLVIGEAFQDGFNPLVTGAVSLLLGLALVAVGVVFFVIPKRPAPARLRVHPALFVPAMVAGVLAFFVLAGNVVTVLRAPDVLPVSVGPGMVMTLLGVVVGLVGLTVGALSPGDAPGAAMPVAAYGAAAPGAVGAPSATAGAGVPTSPAGWFADPTGRHELRYWDGRAWTAAVSDGGATAQDPV